MSQPPPYGEWQDPHQQPTQMAYPAASYGAPASPPGYGYTAYPYPAPAPTNGLAIAALVCALAGLAVGISAPVGAILGHIARRQIRERGEQGDGMALAGIIVGWILTGLFALCCAGYLIVVVFAISQDTSV
jgi:Domain of unknown function (DUF4190)